jgi:hypothetical protein
MSTMDNEPAPLTLEGHPADEVENADLGKCFAVKPDLLVSGRAMDMIGEHNPLRLHDIGVVNLLAAAIMTKAQLLQAKAMLDDSYGGEAGKDVPSKHYNQQLGLAKREAALAITHAELAAIYLRKALERLE